MLGVVSLCWCALVVWGMDIPPVVRRERLDLYRFVNGYENEEKGHGTAHCFRKMCPAVFCSGKRLASEEN